MFQRVETRKQAQSFSVPALLPIDLSGFFHRRKPTLICPARRRKRKRTTTKMTSTRAALGDGEAEPVVNFREKTSSGLICFSSIFNFLNSNQSSKQSLLYINWSEG